MSGFEFCVYKESLPKDWDGFVLAHKYGSIHQTASWKKFQQVVPGRETVIGFSVRDPQKKTLLAVTLCVQMKTGLGNTFWWYSARGPVFDPETSLDSGLFLIHSVRQYLFQTNGIFWRFDPYFSSDQYIQLNLDASLSTQDYQPTDTLEIDLSQSNEAILSLMKRKGRYNINLAQKKGLKLVKKEQGSATKKDLDDFWRLNLETTQRDGFSGHACEYYKAFLNLLKDYAVLFFVETADGVRIATAISTFCGSKAIYYFGASTSHSEYRTFMAPYLLQWEMIQYAKQKKCATYDFLGIAQEGISDHPYQGISEFKWKFGGDRKTYSHGREIILKPLWYSFYRGFKMLKKNIFRFVKH